MNALAAHVLGVSALGLLLVSCGDDCLGISCPLGVAIRITVSSVPVAGPVENVSIQVSDANLPPTTCTVEANATVCRVFGNSGTYTLVWWALRVSKVPNATLRSGVPSGSATVQSSRQRMSWCRSHAPREPRSRFTGSRV